MKRLLIIGAGSEQVVAINKACSMGIEVIVTDMNPSAPGMALAHHAEVVSTHDVAGNLRVAQSFKVHGVITLSSETAVPVVAHIATVMGLPSFSQETAFWATNKNAMRKTT
jgi:formate-dependent phosphoribosylglycinamide formyltransferase (GAR transformylase)